jgi:hypothetical protein
VDIALESVVAAQGLGDPDQMLHGVIRRADDAGREEQALDVVALVELDRERHDLLDREAGAGDVRGASIDAIRAVK